MNFLSLKVKFHKRCSAATSSTWPFPPSLFQSGPGQRSTRAGQSSNQIISQISSVRTWPKVNPHQPNQLGLCFKWVIGPQVIDSTRSWQTGGRLHGDSNQRNQLLNSM